MAQDELFALLLDYSLSPSARIQLNKGPICYIPLSETSWESTRAGLEAYAHNPRTCEAEAGLPRVRN